MDGTLGVALLLVLSGSAVAFTRKLRVAAAPDEWVILIRNGRLVKAGVGITVWRWPWEQAARFTSTLQRVSFHADGLSRERIPVQIQGHLFWSISTEGEGPFQAFRSLGPVNLEVGREEGKHLLGRPQYHAFQQLVAAEVQRLAATHPLEQLLLDQDAFVGRLSKRLNELHGPMGIAVERVELLQVRPADPALLQAMGAKEAEAIRAEAERLKLETDRALRLREQEISQERALAVEADARALDLARIDRETEALEARLVGERKEAEGKREAILILAEAEERKSQALRDYELNCLTVEKSSEAMGRIHEARWVSVGAENPMSAMLSGLQSVMAGMQPSREDTTTGAPR